MCRQRASCKPGTAKADGQRAWWKLPRGSWRVLRVLRLLSVWSLANGRLECPNKRGLCAGKGQAATLEQQRLNSKGWRPEGLVEAAARDVQAKGRLQPWNSKGCRPEGLVAAAARKQCSSWRWKLPRGSWRVLRVLRVLSVWSLANGRLECLNKRGLCAGKGQAAMLERWRPGAWWKLPRGMCRQRAGCNPGTAKADGQRASWKLPRGSWRVLRVLRVWSVWSLANGRLECPNKRGLCAGKGQAAMLERWRPGAWCAARDVQAKGRLQCLSGRLTARGLGGSCREGCAGKGQAATLEQQRLTARGLGGSCRGAF